MPTNYEVHFGTPERAAETLQVIAGKCNDMECDIEVCDSCPIAEPCPMDDGRFLEWLQAAAETACSGTLSGVVREACQKCAKSLPEIAGEMAGEMRKGAAVSSIFALGA